MSGDPWTIIFSGLLGWALASLASWAPKRRAAKLRAENERLLAMLRRLEWNSYPYDDGMCGACGGGEPKESLWTPKGHKPDCELAALLRESS